MFDLTGGGGAAAPTHRLDIQLTATNQQVIVDITTARPDVQNYGINATYTLTEIATGKTVVTGQTFARVSYDIPGQQQRFAGERGLRDAENRAAKVIADNIRVAARVVFRRGDVSARVQRSVLDTVTMTASKPPKSIASSPARSGPADRAGLRTRCRAGARARRRADPRLGRRSERSVRARAHRGRRAGRQSVAAGRGGAHRAAVRRPPRRAGEGRLAPNIAPRGRSWCSPRRSRDCRIVIEAGDLRKTAPLRAVCEKAEGRRGAALLRRQ